MFYEFIKVLEMDCLLVVFSCQAKDLHDAIKELALAGKYNDYDLIKVNGEFI